MVSVVVYTVVFFAASAFMPYSQGFMESNDLLLDENPTAILFHLVNFLWICFTIYFIIRNTPYAGKKLFIRLLYIMFFTIFFITFIGAMYSVEAFEGRITRLDYLFVMLTGLFSLLATIPIMIKFFGNKFIDNEIVQNRKIDIKTIAANLGICGLVYLVAYFIFAYLVQWQFEEFRNFYSDTQWGRAAWSGDRAGLLPWLSITVFRGILNGLFVLPLMSMITKNRRIFIIGLCLIYLAPAINHIAPNPIFPDAIRFLHLAGMTGTMLLFGVIIGNILWRNKKII
jgi:hypothetical protein